MNEETLNTIATFYKFAEFPDFEEWKNKLKDWGKDHEILGTMILAPEGINATVSGPHKELETSWNRIREDTRFSDLSPYVRKSKIYFLQNYVSLPDQNCNPRRPIN